MASPKFALAIELLNSLEREIAATGAASEAAEQVSGRLSSQIDRLAFSLCDLPARSLADCGIKARVFSCYLGGESDLTDGLGLSLCNDIVRVAALLGGKHLSE